MKENFGRRRLAFASLWMVAVSSWWVLGAYYCFLMGSRWSLDGLWMVAVIPWWVLDGYCSFLMGSGWLLLLFLYLISMLRIHTVCSTQKTPLQPVIGAQKFWHITSLKLKEIFGRRELPNLSTSILSPAKISSQRYAWDWLGRHCMGGMGLDGFRSDCVVLGAVWVGSEGLHCGFDWIERDWSAVE